MDALDDSAEMLHKLPLGGDPAAKHAHILQDNATISSSEVRMWACCCMHAVC